MNNPDIIVSIDLGTTFTGVAWTTPNRPIDVIRNWPGTGDGTEKKVPTILLYRQNHTTPSSWGYSALYNEDSQTTRRGFFKIFLDPETLETARSQGHLSVPPSTADARQYVTDFLRLVYTHTKDTIEREMGMGPRGWQDQAVEFIFSVPTTWNNQGIVNDFKRAIREAGYGIGGDRHSASVDLTEAEAAAVATVKYSPVNFARDDVFLCIDAGGGTTDLALMQVTGVDRTCPQMKQIAAVQGVGIGASGIDGMFTRLVEKRLSDYPEVKAELPQNLGVRMARSPYFKMMKHTFGERAFMELPRHPIQMDGVSENFSHAEARIDRGRMIFTIEEFQGLFKPVVQGIINKVKSQLDWFQHQTPRRDDQVKYFVLSGGLGSNKYVQNKLQEHFEDYSHPNAGQVRILCAQEPQLVVVRGLLEDRKQRMESGQSVITSRIARASYGVLVKQLYDPVVHFMPEIQDDPYDGTRFAINQIQWLIKKGDTVTPGQPLVKTLQMRLAADDTTRAWDTKFVVSHNEPSFIPASLKHEGVIQLCKLESNLSGVEQHELVKKHKRGTCFRAGYTFYICEFEIHVIVAPADLRFELWFGGHKFSKGHEPIKIHWQEGGTNS
ncbi:hypothetical protein PG990_013456 [Apiospora arundinis]|uniref:Hsp70 family chaperone n=1 Tax=Apiospora arundinis TaxID=335852 RepID=A0ABR2IBU1_9PEZI